ncbi:MAG TPA: hypothetical protein VGN09_26390 [Vicinamibacteria bacterium]|jgi:putative ABC transport system permease protein
MIEALGVFTDLRYELRRLRCSPGSTALAILAIGRGVGATTVMFSAVHGVLIKPLPYPGPDLRSPNTVTARTASSSRFSLLSSRDCARLARAHLL